MRACVHVSVCLSVSVAQVHIDETDNTYGATRLGVVRASPDAVAMPEDSWHSFHSDVLCVWSGGVHVFGQLVRLW